MKIYSLKYYSIALGFSLFMLIFLGLFFNVSGFWPGFAIAFFSNMAAQYFLYYKGIE